MVRLPPNLLRGLIGGLSIRFPSQGGERRPAVAQARIPVNMGVAVAMGVVIGQARDKATQLYEITQQLASSKKMESVLLQGNPFSGDDCAKGYETTVEELLHPENAPDIEDDLVFRYRGGWTIHDGTLSNICYWVYRMINTKRPLEEKIALFWKGVLCTDSAKVDNEPVEWVNVEMLRTRSFLILQRRLDHLAG